MSQIPIDLDIEEGRVLFEALAELPFKHVFELIGKINETANRNLAASSDPASTTTFSFTKQELKLIIGALGELPFHRVHSLVEKIDKQVKTPDEKH